MKNFDENYWQFIDKNLQGDCYFIANLELSTLLLLNDENYPWLILVPRLSNVFDLTDLDFEDQKTLLKEINFCSQFLKNNFQVDKLNIASLGNIVKQLHIHIIARNKDDITFPKPVWGNSMAKKYQNKNADELIVKIRQFIITNNI